MNITVPIDKAMAAELRAIRRGMEADQDRPFTMAEVYSCVMVNGIEQVISGFCAVDDDDPANLAYLKARGTQ